MTTRHSFDPVRLLLVGDRALMAVAADYWSDPPLGVRARPCVAEALRRFSRRELRVRKFRAGWWLEIMRGQTPDWLCHVNTDRGRFSYRAVCRMLVLLADAEDARAKEPAHA